MDSAAYEPIFARQLEQLRSAIADEGLLPQPVVCGRRVLVHVEGIRQDGQRDRFALVIDARRFPVHPFDAGFAPPDTPPAFLGDVTFKDARWFPFDGERSFKTAFEGAKEGEPKVFICVQPGFSEEYFYYHVGEAWNPHRWTLSQVVAQVRQALNASSYIQPNWERP